MRVPLEIPAHKGRRVFKGCKEFKDPQGRAARKATQVPRGRKAFKEFKAPRGRRALQARKDQQGRKG